MENSFERSLDRAGISPLTAAGVSTVQVNLGAYCNLSCRHCHVEAGPGKGGHMGGAVMAACIRAIDAGGERRTVDITGGAPEAHPGYRRFVEACSKAGHHVITRTNLAILALAGFEDLPAFFAGHRVEVIASLPHYTEAVTERIRGKGVFKSSIKALQSLNEFGYGVSPGLKLNIAYNPSGAFLPAPQEEMEKEWRHALRSNHGVVFDSLYAITNMPVGRFLSFLKASGNLKAYTGRLLEAFNPDAAKNVMCRGLLSVGADGSLYDCDFNQALGLKCGYGAPDNIRNFDAEALGKRRIVTGEHCYGCTAGAGSSCTGEVV